MTSDRKIRANRANAQRSTGAKNPAGRARSASNAFRHGLSIPLASDPLLAEEVTAMAQRLAGAHAGVTAVELAAEVAAAHLEVRRVRQARHQLLLEALSNPYLETLKDTRRKMKQISFFLDPGAPEVSEFMAERFFASWTSTPQGEAKFAIAFTKNANRLAALNRYEARALARRKFAIRALDDRAMPGQSSNGSIPRTHDR